jgi:fatty acid synthase
MFALEHAVKDIVLGNCDQAIVAGVNLLCKPQTSLQFHCLSMLSKEGMCKAFDSTGKSHLYFLSSVF